MPLPRAIQKQVDEANKLVEQMQQAPESEDTEAQQPEPEKAEAQQPEPEKAEAQQPEPEAKPEEPAWEQRYRVLQGKYNAEVPRLTNELRQTRSELDELRSQLQQMQKQGQKASEDDALISPEEVADYGEDFMDLVGRKAKQIARDEVRRLEEQVQRLTSQLQNVGQTVQKTGRQTVLEKLDAEVENWREQNHDPEFLMWLDEPDIYSGAPRKRLFDEALNRNDADRVVAFFKGFLREHATTTQQAAAKPPKGDTSKAKLDGLIAPGKPRGGSNQTGARDEKRTYSEQEYSAAHREYLRGKMPKEDWDAFERDFMSAVADGRVIPANRTPVSNAAF